MVRVARNSVKTEQISIRLPVDLLNELESLKKRDGIDRSIIIVKALRYWVSVEGNVSTDNEFINQISEMKTEIGELKNSISDLSKTYEKETHPRFCFRAAPMRMRNRSKGIRTHET